MPRLSTLIATVVVAAGCLAPAAFAQFNIFGIGHSKAPPAALAKALDQPVPVALFETLARASRAGIAFTGKAAPTDLIAISGPRPGSSDKPGLLYIGADFCPYCAGERWGLALTLLRFGQLDGVRYMLSSATDAHANTPTFSFQHAAYHSRYLDFQAVETADRLQRQLMTPNALQLKILARFDAPPYMPSSGGIPFVYLDGKYVLNTLLAAPQELDGKDWTQIADALADPTSPLFQSVMPKVNLLTAAICRTNGGKPASVCRAPGVKAAGDVLAAARKVGG
jgi:hypothetical protein